MANARNTQQSEAISHPPATPAPWLSPEAAAAYLGGISKLTLADWRTKGIGPVFHKAGALVRYRQADLDAWMENGAKKGA